MSEIDYLFWRLWLLVALVLVACNACSSFPPSSVSAGFMGASVTVATPGWSAPVPVVASTIVTTPTLMVPANSPAAKEETASVAPTATTAGAIVPVVIMPVTTSVLAVPVIK